MGIYSGVSVKNSGALSRIMYVARVSSKIVGDQKIKSEFRFNFGVGVYME